MPVKNKEKNEKLLLDILLAKLKLFIDCLLKQFVWPYPVLVTMVTLFTQFPLESWATQAVKASYEVDTRGSIATWTPFTLVNICNKEGTSTLYVLLKHGSGIQAFSYHCHLSYDMLPAFS